MKRIIAIVSAALMVVLTSSCLKDQQDYFGKTAASRMTDYLADARDILLHPEGGLGWRMEYYTDFGGYNYALKFSDDGSVTVWSETKPLSEKKTLYKMASDNGPILSLDTYNEIFHFFAEANSSYYQSRGGDFEFIIISATPEKVVLKGKRSGYISTLYPLSVSPSDFVKDRGRFARDFILLEFTGEVGSQDYTAKIDLIERSVTFAQYDQDGVVVGDEYSMNFIYDENRMKLRDTLKVNGESFTYFEYEPAQRTVSCNNKCFFFAARIPEEYTYFDKFPGTYSFTYNGSTTTDVTLEVEDEFERVLLCKGLGTYEIRFYYDANKGCLNIPAQYISLGDDICYHEDFPNVPIVFLGISSKGSGSLYFSMDAYRKGGTDANPKFAFRSGTATDDVQSFSLYGMGEDDEPGDGWYEGSKWTPTSVKPNLLVKK